MKSLLVLKARNEVDAHVPEFDYLLQQLVIEARTVYDQVELLISDSASTAEIDTPESDHILVIDEANILLRRHSLRRMSDQVQAGFDLVTPRPITEFPAALQNRPIYTQRGFELLEAQLIDEGDVAKTGEGTLSPLPVCLMSRPLFDSLQTAGELSAMLSSPASLLAELQRIWLQRGSGTSARAGVYHQFIDYYGETRADILPYIPESTGDRLHVLEVGCGRGGTAELLARERDCRVTGVELNPVVAEVARQRMHEVLSGDIEELEIDGAFDVFLALEVIEHLSDPKAFLHKARELTKPGGRIVLSTPNVGHYPVVEDLLAGRWDYSATGVLCATHIRFFTRTTLEDLLRRCGFGTFAIHGQHTELPERVSKLADSIELDLESLRTRDLVAVVDL